MNFAQRKNLRIARFLNRIVFCFFAEDTGLLPKKLFSDLLKTIPVPDQVYKALVDKSGPYEYAIHLVRCLEGGTAHDIVDAADRAMLEMRTINRALLHALAGAIELS